MSQRCRCFVGRWEIWARANPHCCDHQHSPSHGRRDHEHGGRRCVDGDDYVSTQVVATGAILQMTKAHSAPIVPVGGQLVYTLQYWNAGDQAAEGVFLTDTLPSGITVTAAYPPPITSLTSPQLVWICTESPQLFQHKPSSSRRRWEGLGTGTCITLLTLQGSQATRIMRR